MNITQEEINKLKDTKNEQEWNKVCNEIKRARNRQYPEDWWPKVVQSGLMATQQSKWNS